MPDQRPARSGRIRELPEDLLREAAHRLGILCLVGAGLWTTVTLVGHVIMARIAAQGYPIESSPVPDAISVISIAISLGLFLYTRLSTRSPQFLLDLGLGYMIVTTLAIGLSAHLGGDPVSGVHPGPPLIVEPVVSWGGAVVLMFPGLIPSTPRKTTAAILVAASMDPLTMLLMPARGVDIGPLSNVLVMHYTNYLQAAVGVVIAHVVASLGRQVSKAREMGSYELQERIGIGGMGEVYRARHRLLARPAAIKLIRPDALLPGDSRRMAVQRFRREAEAVANLQSPHTVALYDFGVTVDGTFYYVMELLTGLDLDSLVRQFGRLPPGRAVHLLRQVCDSLAEAHACGLVHRDVKPSNIFTGRYGLDYDFVKVLDFGLVKSIKMDVTTSIATQRDITPGTPAFMPPEFALAHPVDCRSDLYSLGCVAYWLLTGRLVFEARTPILMVSRHLNDRAPPPSQVNPAIPPALDQAILACLEKNPENRPRSALDLAAQLAACDVEPWTSAMAEQWWRDHAPAWEDTTPEPASLLGRVVPATSDPARTPVGVS